MAEVRLSGVVKRFDGATIVHGLDLVAPDGSFTVLVGPSGCGKSTTLRMIAGLEEPTLGDVFIGGRRVNDLLPRDRDVAMVFQSYALYPHMTVRENVGFGLRVRDVPDAEIEARVAEAAAMLGIDALLDRRPAQLSGGQRQRVAMGRAIVRRPQVFLFDEPLSNLDAKLRGAMRAEIARLHARLRATSVYVTHDQLEAMTLADTIVLMNAGRVEQTGPPLELWERPATTFAAEFFGSPPMSLFDAEIEAGEARAGALRIPVAAAATGPVRLGLRPQDFVEGGPIPLDVEVVEAIGSETFVHGRAGGLPLVARLPASVRPKPGETVPLGIDPERVHMFGRDGRRLTSSSR